MIYYLTLNIILTIVLNYAWLVNQTSLEPLDEPVKLVPLHYTLSLSLALSLPLSLSNYNHLLHNTYLSYSNACNYGVWSRTTSSELVWLIPSIRV